MSAIGGKADMRNCRLPMSAFDPKRTSAFLTKRHCSAQLARGAIHRAFFWIALISVSGRCFVQ